MDRDLLYQILYLHIYSVSRAWIFYLPGGWRSNPMASNTRHRSRPDPSQQTCPECESPVDQSNTEIYCRACGVVVEESPIDHGPEWRSFDKDERERTGAPCTVTLHDRGLSTEIGYGGDTALSARKRRRLSRQRQLHSRSRFASKRDRNLAYGLGEIRRLVAALDQGTSVQKQAAQLFKRTQDADLLRGRSIESGATAAVYVACRRTTVIRMRRVADAARCSKQAAWNMYRTLQHELDLQVPLQRPVDWVPKILSSIPHPVPIAVRHHAMEVAECATESTAINGCPTGVAAASVYFVSQQHDKHWTQETISDTVDVSVETLRKWFHELQNLLDA